MRRPWLIFGVLLATAIMAFTVSAEWSAQSWLDLAAYVVSVIAFFGVVIYALGRETHGAGFWRAFRWVFIAVVAGQVLVHAVGTAKQHGYSAGGTIVFVAVISTIMGLIFALQWIAMTRLANEQ